MAVNKDQGSLIKQSMPFTQTPNTLINDKSIKGIDKAVYTYIASKPHGWDFSAYRIANDFLDKIDAIKASLRRLEKAGWLSRVKRNTGRTDYTLHSICTPKVEIPTVGKTLKGKNHPISNKENNKERERSKKEKNKESPSSSVSEFFLFNAYKQKQSPRKNSRAFYDFLLVHDKYWKQKHNPIKDSTIIKYSKLVEDILKAGEWRLDDQVTHFFKTKRTGDSQFPLFAHWLYGQWDEDYRSFDGEGEKLSLCEMQEFISDYYRE
jgi:hypothetical protein